MNIRLLIGGAALCLTLYATGALAVEFDQRLQEVQHDWAVANYQIEDADQREAAFEQLVAKAEALAADYPQRAEALIWQGIVYSSFAGAKGGLGALGLAKKARASLEAALKIDPKALDGSAYTSLGTLYHKVPGFPLGFGSDKKARKFLLKALEINPDGIDSNYFYGEFLVDEKQFDEARKYLERALAAPPRPGRPIADQGRRWEIQALLQKIADRGRA
ncbi:MAG: hypothetical protein D6727_04995 [Gammaproteobacteria bacterium]|nr:MAG: hypothetical protein D6727_04995 [Gammaproteobacteria bacterium]